MPDWSEHIFRIEALPLEILKFRAGYITSAPVELPPFSGGVFRGLFGRVLKERHCPFPEEICPGEACPRQEDCLYSFLFETPLTAAMREALPPSYHWARAQAWPHPIIINPRNSGGRLPAGAQIDLEITLMGRAIARLDEILAAFQACSGRSIGQEGTTPSPIAFAEAEPLAYRPPAVSHSSRAWRIAWKTPLQVPFRPDRSAISFERLLSSMISKTRMCCYYHQGQALDVDYYALRDKARAVVIEHEDLRPVKAFYRSSRQGESVNLSGLVGQVTCRSSGTIAPFVPFLRFASACHCGKKGIYGMGEMTIEDMDPTPSVRRTDTASVHFSKPCFPRCLPSDQLALMIDSLPSAWELIRKKGARGGIDQVAVDDFALKADQHLSHLKGLLNGHRYCPEAQVIFDIPKNVQETREIRLLTVADKVVQQAFRLALEPAIDARFHDFSYGYRPGRGIRRAIHRLRHELGLHGPYAVSADIDDFFDTLDHPTLLEIARSAGMEDEVLRILEMWISVGGIARSTYWKDHTGGISQGSVVSPLLANMYLHPFDQFTVDEGMTMVRYADDWVAVARTIAACEEILAKTSAYLGQALHMAINPPSPPLHFQEQGVEFLGTWIRGDWIAMAPAKLAKKRAFLEELVRGDAPLEEKLRILRDKVGHWRRYYRNLLSPAPAEEMDFLLIETLKQLVANADKAEHKALTPLPLFRDHDQAELLRIQKAILSAPRIQAPPAGTPVTAKTAVKRIRRSTKRALGLQGEIVIDRPGVVLGKTQKKITLRFKGEKIHEAPIRSVRQILIMSRGVSVSSDLIRLAAQRSIAIDYIDHNGRPYARLTTPGFSRQETGRCQLAAYTNGRGARLIRKLVLGKVNNQFVLLKYFNKYRKDQEAFSQAFATAATRLESIIKTMKSEPISEFNAEQARSAAWESQAAISYWQVIRQMNIGFEGRERKGAQDKVNVMLNYGYGILYGRLWWGITLAGLHPTISYLHQGRRDDPALVYDLIEEFRAPVVDRTVFALCSRKAPINVSDQGILDQDSRLRLSEAVLKRLHTVVDFRGQEKTLMGIIVHQARAVARFLRQEAGDYVPFSARW